MGEGPMILALDVATTTGYCYGRPGAGDPVYGSIRFAAEGAPNSAVYGGAVAWAAGLIPRLGVNRIVMEEPLDPRHLGARTNKKTMRRLVGLPAVLDGVAYQCGVRSITEVTIAEVRLAILGRRPKRDVAKQEVMWAVQARGFPTDDDNAADAVAIWLYTCQEFGRRL